MNAYDRAARALLVLRTELDTGAAGDHRTAALGALLELWAAGASDLWLRVAVAELWSGRHNPGELRAVVDDCLQRATQALVAEAAPRRTSTILPPPSGDEEGGEEREERAAARASLDSVEVDSLGWGEVGAVYSTMPASVRWVEVEERRAGGGLRL